MARVLGLETRHTARSGLLVRVLRSSVSVLFKASLPCPQVLAEPNACALNCVQSGRSVAPQAEKERYLLGPTEHSSITHVEAAPFPPSCAAPTVQRKCHPRFILCGRISPPSGRRERVQPCFYKRLNAGLYRRPLSYLCSPFSQRIAGQASIWGLISPKYGISFSTQRTENALHAVVYLSPSHPPPCFILIFGA